jgi:predicted RNA-binding Zn-ribbon protein involved in translation (DUF1610 family)
MTKDAISRSKYWWLWPNFYSEKDARDGAKMGVLASGLIAVMTGAAFSYRYVTDNDVFGLAGGLFVSLVWCVLSYGFFRMSRVASLTALLLFVADKAYTVGIEGKSLGIASILVLYLVNANRAIYWFKGKRGMQEAKPSETLNCESCGAVCDLADYNQDAAVWLCPACGKALPRR